MHAVSRKRARFDSHRSQNFQNFQNFQNSPKYKADDDDGEFGDDIACGVRRDENVTHRVYLWNAISSEVALKLIKILTEIKQELQVFKFKSGAQIQTQNKVPIELYINSGGGCLFSALTIHDFITALDWPVYATVTGRACSGAALVLLACERRFMFEHSFVLMHNLLTSFSGKYQELLDETHNSKTLNETMSSIILKQTKLKRRELQELLSRDVFLGRKECVQKGIVHASSF